MQRTSSARWLADEPVEKQLMVTHSAGGDALLDVTLQGVTVQAHEVTIRGQRQRGRDPCLLRSGTGARRVYGP